MLKCCVDWGKAMNILITYSQKLMETWLTLILQEQNYHVISTPNGCDACQILATQRIDIVVLEIAFPTSNIFELIKTMHRYSDVIIVLSAFSQKFIIQQLMNAGAAVHITKPFPRYLLLDTIDNHIKTEVGADVVIQAY